MTIEIKISKKPVEYQKAIKFLENRLAKIMKNDEFTENATFLGVTRPDRDRLNRADEILNLAGSIRPNS